MERTAYSQSLIFKGFSEITFCDCKYKVFIRNGKIIRKKIHIPMHYEPYTMLNTVNVLASSKKIRTFAFRFMYH